MKLNSGPNLLGYEMIGAAERCVGEFLELCFHLLSAVQGCSKPQLSAAAMLSSLGRHSGAEVNTVASHLIT